MDGLVRLVHVCVPCRLRLERFSRDTNLGVTVAMARAVVLLLHCVAQVSCLSATPLSSAASSLKWEGKMRDRPVAFRAKELASAPVFDVLKDDGIVRVNGALSAPVGATLLAHVNDALELALDRMREEASFDLGDNVLVRYFGNVMEKVNRHDLKLELTPPVQDAVSELLVTLQPCPLRHQNPQY